MAVKDYTGEFINTLRFFQPNVKPIDFSGVLDKYNEEYDKAHTKALNNAFSDALASGDNEKASKIAAMLDPAGERARQQAISQRAEDRQWALEDAERKQQNALDLLAQQTKNAFALENLRNQNARNLAEFKAGLGTSVPQNLPDGYVLTGNKKYDDAYMQEFGKKEAQKKLAEQDSEEMKDSVIKAMLRADKAAQSGNGIGRLGAGAEWLGLNPTSNSGKNYTDIESANTQMNTFLRKQLASTGLTGSELNSAVEAEAYRYKVSPFDSEARIRNKLKNFAEDKLGITELDLYKSKYGLD